MMSWVLLRGLTREAGHWGDFTDRLARALGGAPVLALDLPGAGRLHTQRSPTDIGGIVQACRAQLADHGVATPVALLGLSMGGMVALEWSRSHPAEVRRLVLVNTSLGGVSPPWRRLRVTRWPALAQVATRWSDAAVEHLVLQLTSAHPGRHGPVLAHWQALRSAHPVSSGNAWRQLLAAARFRAAARAPAVPALVVTGAGDRLVDPTCGAAIARRWSWPLLQHPWAGHDLPLDDGDWLANQVAAWSESDRVARA
jgi:pimeloyl-ACP methyl ester carboxylesterase